MHIHFLLSYKSLGEGGWVSWSWRGALNITLRDKVCQWFSPGPPVSSINKADHHNITEILLKVALNTINHTVLLLCFNMTVLYIVL